MNRMLGFCIGGVWVCAPTVRTPAPIVDAAASAVLPSRSARRSSGRGMAFISSRLSSVLTACSSLLPDRLELALHAFRTGLGSRILGAVMRELIVGLTSGQVRIFPDAGLIRRSERSDLVAEPGVLPDDVEPLLRI